MPAISIIMPLYNAERYLAEALQSVVKQTYGNFELICIDDCSTDGTRKIVEAFRRKDGRIRMLINEAHAGAAPSRNKGLRAAVGEYILFLDGDDIFEEELLEKAAGAMEKYQTDLVLFEYLHVPSESVYTKKVIERPENFEERYCTVPFSMEDFAPREFPWWASSPCNKMFLRHFLIREGLEFQDLPSSNDVFFAQMALFCARKMICLNDRRVMVYARDHSQPQRISNRRNLMCCYAALEHLCKKLRERGMLGKYAPYLYYRLPAYLIHMLSLEKNEERRRKLYHFLQTEGVCRCVEYGKEYYGQIDEYDRYLLESFQENAYESRWFENQCTYFQYYLQQNGDVICDYIKVGRAQNRNMILWGAGVNGESLLEYLEAHSLKLFGVADQDRSKQGTIVGGYVIADPAAFMQEADHILVTSIQLYREVSHAVRNTGGVVVDLLAMLTERKTDS